jgi:crotonobetainyl-CoA:carnitine CoA-transferase CaiB-like acyl-CoA transferase
LNTLPLAGIRVLDLSRVLAGPLSAMVLADLGADVVKLEQPGTGDGTRDWGKALGPHDSTYFQAFNRSKRSAVADLTTAEGQNLVRSLVAGADVLVENFRRGTMERFGLGYEALKQLNPQLVYCAVAGYDPAGEEADRPGYDIVLQGETGVMATNGEPGGSPLKFGLPVVDMFTGMAAAQAMLAALLSARLTGQGRRIDISLSDVGLSLTSYYGLEALVSGAEVPRYGNFHSSIVPYGVFDAADGPFVLAAGTTRQYQQVCRSVIERPDLADDPRFATNLDRVRNRTVLMAELVGEFARRKRSVLLARLAELEVPAGEVLGLYEALASNRASGMLTTHDGGPGSKPLPGFLPPWRLDGVRPPARRPPHLGEHTAEVNSGPWRTPRA